MSPSVTHQYDIASARDDGQHILLRDFQVSDLRNIHGHLFHQDRVFSRLSLHMKLHECLQQRCSLSAERLQLQWWLLLHCL